MYELPEISQIPVEVLKARIEDLGLPKQIEGRFIKAHMRTLRSVCALGPRGILSLLQRDSAMTEFVCHQIRVYIKKKSGEFVVETIENDPSGIELNSKPTQFSPEKYLDFLTGRYGENYSIITAFSGRIDPYFSVFGYIENRYGIKLGDLQKRSRRADLVEARDAAIFLLHSCFRLSYSEIARKINRDHTSVIYSFEKTDSSERQARVLRLVSDFKGFSNIAILEREDHNEYWLIISVQILYLLSITGEYSESVECEELVEIFTPVLLLLQNKLALNEREESVLEKYRLGLTLDVIGEQVHLTRERVRQILEGVFEKESFNIFIDSGEVIEPYTLKEREEDQRRIKRHSGKKPKAVRLIKWSRDFDACTKCNSTKYHHFKKGLCEKCGGCIRGKTREELFSKIRARCLSCGLDRASVVKKFGRDLYIRKNGEMLCRGCFRKQTGIALGSYRNFEWSRNYASCVICGTDRIPHKKKGYCFMCADATPSQNRETYIKRAGSICQVCELSRDQSREAFESDLCVLSSGDVLCIRCALERNRTLGHNNG